MSESKSKEPSVSVVPAKQGSSNLSESTWIDRTVWNDRMLAALGNGVKGKCPNKYFSQKPGFSPCKKRGRMRANHDVETIDRRAVCGRTACTVRREGRQEPSLPLSRVEDTCIPSLLVRLEVQRNRVHAEAFTRGRWAVVEHVAEMGATPTAEHFGAHHAHVSRRII